jgi:DMSO/TMAO reductase YedYZ molybdopterin-dependent catalytic subunit
MALFVVHHTHLPDRCPARDPYLGAQLLNQLSRPSLKAHGVELRTEVVLEDQHTFFMVLEAPDAGSVVRFAEPFFRAGTVDIHPASTCVRVVAGGGCGINLPVDEFEGALDPEEACQRAIDAGLLVHRAHPLNGETSVAALIGGVVMPSAHFYVRNHFQIPLLDAPTWQLAVGGSVERPLNLSLADIHAMRAQSLPVTLECAGNGRALLDPPVPGESWRFGAVSTAEGTGVPLIDVLERAGIRPGARNIIFRGADHGAVEGRAGPVPFERSLTVEQARDPAILLAYAMNGEPLPVQHGYPLRLIVPGWYAVASVKWLSQIEVIDGPFEGFFQTDRYFIEHEVDGAVVKELLTLQNVRSLITDPDPGTSVPRGALAVRGVAWSGAAPIERVEVRLNDQPWQAARLIGESRRGSWQWWELLTEVDGPGKLVLRSRATDQAGRTQPETPAWNRLGYGNNVVHEVALEVF